MSSLKSFKLKFTGESPLLMHSDKLANPLSEITKRMKSVSSKRVKTDDDHEAMAAIEFEGALYYDEDMGVFMPSHMVKACLVNGAKKQKKGTQAKAGIIIFDGKLPLAHDGGKTIQELWKNREKFSLTTSVVVSRARIMRTRPKFPTWSFVAEIHYDETLLNKAEIVEYAEKAGMMCGLGDWRIEKGGEYGRFTVSEV